MSSQCSLVHSCDGGIYQYSQYIWYNHGSEEIHSIAFGLIPLFNILMYLSILEITKLATVVAVSEAIAKLSTWLLAYVDNLCVHCAPNIYTITFIHCHIAIQTSGQAPILLHSTGRHWPREWHQTLIWAVVSTPIPKQLWEAGFGVAFKTSMSGTEGNFVCYTFVNDGPHPILIQ